MHRPWRMRAAKPISRAQDTVSMLMRRNFVSVGPGESLLEADRIMRLARIRHLPVVDGGRLVGVLSHRDVLEAAIPKGQASAPEERTRHLRSLQIRDVMRTNPYTAEAHTTLGDAARRMLRLKVGCLPVVRPGLDGEELIGLVTESDLLRAAYAPDFEGASD